MRGAKRPRAARRSASTGMPAHNNTRRRRTARDSAERRSRQPKAAGNALQVVKGVETRSRQGKAVAVYTITFLGTSLCKAT
eukprot:224315-Lingulodinium_polyedra.AAC.1